MKALEEIEPFVRKYFKYLAEDFEFEETPSSSQPFIHSIDYFKSNLIVSIRYAYRHDYLEPMIFNKKFPVGSETFKNVNLLWLIVKDNPKYDYRDYDKLMPKQIDLEESVKIIADLFHRYAASFLAAKEWLSWEEIAELYKSRR